MRRHTFWIVTAAALVSCSAILYGVHYLVFADAHHIFLYLLGDVAFVPVEVLLVIVVIERVLAVREKRVMLNKLNMVIGAFFSEVGTGLMGDLTRALADREGIRERLAVSSNWRARDFAGAIAFARGFSYQVIPGNIDLAALRDRLVEKRDFLVRLLENPNLLEHERFTDLLWAVFHLCEELDAREDLSGLPQTDINHLAGDMQRVYSQLLAEWIAYARHLQADYPFLFSLVVRTHPLQDHPSAIVA